MAGYFVETIYKAEDKVSGTLNKIIQTLEKTEVASKSLLAVLDKVTLGFAELGKISRVEIGGLNASLGGMNAALTRTNAKMMQFDERGVFALKVMNRMNTQAQVTAAGMNVLGRSTAGAMGAMRGIGLGGSGGGGSHSGGGSHGSFGSKLGALPGHVMNRVFDAWMMEQVLGGAIEPGIKREEAQLRLRKTGLFSKGEENQANAMAKQLTQLLPNTSITENLDKITELAQGMQRASVALKLAPAMLSKASVMDFMAGEGGHIDKNKAFSTGRVLELLNKQTASPKEQMEIIDLIARSSATTHGKAGPDALAKYFASMGATRFGADPKETIGFASYAIQEMGQRAGSQMNAFQRALNLGTMTQGGIDGLQKGGLLPNVDPSTIKSSAQKRQFAQGNLFKRDLLQHDVHAWMYEALDQILKSEKVSPDQFKKMNTAGKQNLLLSVFSGLNMNALAQSQMLGLQLDTIAEHKANMAKSDTSSGNVQNTLGSKVGAVGKAWDDFMGTLVTSGPIMNSLKQGLDGMNNALRSLNGGLSTFGQTGKALDHLGKTLPNIGDGFMQVGRAVDWLAGLIINVVAGIGKAVDYVSKVMADVVFNPDRASNNFPEAFDKSKPMLDNNGRVIGGKRPALPIGKRGYGGMNPGFVPPPPPTIPSGGFVTPPGMLGPDGKPMSALNSHAPGKSGPIIVNVNAPIHGNVNMPDFQKSIQDAVGMGVKKGIQASNQHSVHKALLHQATTSQANSAYTSSVTGGK